MPTPQPASFAHAFVIALALVLPAGCSDDPGGYVGPQPGATPPGQPCSKASDCGCWACTCKGVSGAPGGAQLCNGTCPTGQDACATVCKYLGVPVDMATPDGSCPAEP